MESSAPLLDLDDVPKPTGEEDLESPVAMKTVAPLGHSTEELVSSPLKDRLHTGGHSQHPDTTESQPHPTESLILSHRPDGSVRVSGDGHHLPNGAADQYDSGVEEDSHNQLNLQRLSASHSQPAAKSAEPEVVTTVPQPTVAETPAVAEVKVDPKVAESKEKKPKAKHSEGKVEGKAAEGAAAATVAAKKPTTKVPGATMGKTTTTHTAAAAVADKPKDGNNNRKATTIPLKPPVPKFTRNPAAPPTGANKSPEAKRKVSQERKVTTTTTTRTSTVGTKKTAESKVGSLDYAAHKPGGGNVKIENRKMDFSSVKPKIPAADNLAHKPGGGDKKIETLNLTWRAESKVGSMANVTYKPTAARVKVTTQKLEWKAESKIGSLDNAAHKPVGVVKKIESKKLDFKANATSKIGSLQNATHKPAGGNVKISSQKLDFTNIKPKIGSLDPPKSPKASGRAEEGTSADV